MLGLFVPRTYTICGGGVWELHINLVGEVGIYSSKGRCDLLSMSTGGALLTQIFILLQTTSCYPVKKRYVARGS